MSVRVILVECATPEDLVRAARGASAQGLRATDALTPFYVDELDAALALPATRVRPAMLLGGLLAAAGIFVLQLWYSTRGYPLNSGGRPLDAWPAFLIPTFETGVLGAAVAGFVALLVGCGLPRLNHPLFDAPASERITRDGFFLVIDAADEDTVRRAAALPGVVAVREGFA